MTLSICSKNDFFRHIMFVSRVISMEIAVFGLLFDQSPSVLGAHLFLRTNARPYPSPNVQLIGKNGAPRLQIAPQLKPSPAQRLKKTCVSRTWTRPAQCPHSMSAERSVLRFVVKVATL